MKHSHDIHVVYIITKLELGGAQKVCLSLFEGMQSNNAHATLISSPDGILTDKVKNNPNVILLNNLQREVSLRGIAQEIRCFFTLIRELKKLKKKHPHLIVHTHSTKAGIWGRWGALFAGVKKRIHTVHGYAFHPHQSWIVWSIIYLCELLTSTITTHFICVSSEDVKIGIKLFPRFGKKHSIIRAAVDTQAFFPAQVSEEFPAHDEPFIFGTVACFKPQKNLFDLLHAFEVVHSQNPKTHLEIIGDGILRPAIEQWISEHNLQENITLHGWQNNVAQIMKHWHAFALSSLWEGLPCAIIEARLLKLPVLSYNTGGIHDVILHGENGLLFAQKDWQALALGMLELSRSDALYMKLKMYPDELNDFDSPQMVKEHLKLYKRC